MNNMRLCDPDKIADTPFEHLFIHGVKILSRYGKRREFVLMSRVISALPASMRENIRSIYCNSKCGANYSVILKDNDALICSELSHLFCVFSRGHNGISVSRGVGEFWGDVHLCDVDAEWDDAP